MSLPSDYAWVAGRLRRALREVPEHWSTGAGAPVVLIAGVYEPWSFLADVGERLNRAGHPVHAVPAIGRNRIPLSDGGRHGLEYLVANDLRHVRIVAHSKGGLVGKQLMAIDPDARVERLIAIATPFGGSAPAKYAPVRTLRDLAPAAGELAELGRRTDLNSRITSIYTRWDPHIPGGSRLDGARNIELPLVGHFRLLADELLLSTVEREAGMD